MPICRADRIKPLTVMSIKITNEQECSLSIIILNACHRLYQTIENRVIKVRITMGRKKIKTTKTRADPNYQYLMTNAFILGHPASCKTSMDIHAETSIPSNIIPTE